MELTEKEAVLAKRIISNVAKAINSYNSDDSDIQDIFDIVEHKLLSESYLDVNALAKKLGATDSNIASIYGNSNGIL